MTSRFTPAPSPADEQKSPPTPFSPPASTDAATPAPPIYLAAQTAAESAPVGQPAPGALSTVPAPPVPGAHREKDARHPGSWRSTFFTGLVLWIASVVVTGLTGSLNMIPTVVLLGSFLVPATAVVWYFDHYHSDVVTPALAVRGFILGGVLGVLAASVLEAWLLSSGVLIFVGVGLIEEFAKGIGLFFVARHLRRYTVRDGIVLGAAVGFGFAALESSGYALNALIVPQGSGVVLSLGNLVTTEVLRGILAPVGHGLWTAILGGAMFGAARKVGHLRVNGAVFWTYLLVSLLHAIWDSMQMIAILFATLFLATQGQILDPWTGRVVPPPAAEAFSYLGFYFGGLIILSLVGIGILAHSWRSAGARLPAEIGTTTASNAGDVPTIAPHDLPS